MRLNVEVCSRASDFSTLAANGCKMKTKDIHNIRNFKQVFLKYMSTETVKKKTKKGFQHKGIPLMSLLIAVNRRPYFQSGLIVHRYIHISSKLVSIFWKYTI